VWLDWSEAGVQHSIAGDWPRQDDGAKFEVQMEITVGSKVWLNSGSPALDVTKIEGDLVTVTWLNDDGNVSFMTAKSVCFSPQEVALQI
jgi:pyruvate kinase